MENLFFTDNVHAAKKKVMSFLQKELEPIKNDINRANKIPIAILKKMGKEGLFGPLIPQKYRGTELGIIAHCMITEEISKINVAVSVSRTPCILMGYLLNKFSKEQQKEKYLKQVATGDKICSICVTEEMAGSNVADIKTTAEKKGNSYLLNGSKKFITNAGLSDYYFIWAISNQNVNPRGGMSVFLVEKDIPGLRIENPYNLMGINGIYNGNLELKNVEIPEENLIGMEGNGFNDLMDVFNIERLTLSSECNGIALAALEESKNYAKTRIQFNKPIASFQLIKLKIAEMATKLQAARLLTFSAAKLSEMKLNFTKEASMAKAYSSKTSLEIASEAVQIHGGNGYTDMYPVERYMRDAKFFMIGGGTTEIQNLIIAREELKK
ncbi:MAG: acyl-CoA/acyl-ACP dehydrogenase [Candidatus Lokiarchaeota archaeon]|nr:acyl-CoA/acyl-ACP dehydrogenase [Candidatus Lokiarchaeota archaeon]